MAITYLDDEPTDTQSRITYLDDEPAPTVEAPLQTPFETGARAAGTGLVESVTGFQSGVGEVRQSLSDIARQYVGETPADIFDALTVVPRTLGPMARQAGAAAQEFFAPDAERNPKSAAIGSGLGQAPALIGAGFVAGPAAPIAMGAFSGFGSGAETARDMGITDPLAIAGMGAGFAGVEAATERMFGIGNKAATEAMQAAARRSLPQMFGAAARGTLGEGAEEIIAGTGQDALSAAMAPQGYDVSRFQVMDPETGDFNPDYLNRRGLEALGGMAGGAVFSGADALLNARKAPEVLAPVADPLAAAAASFPEAAPTITYLDDATDARFQPPLSASVTPGPQPTAVLSPAPSELAAGSSPATGAISAELPTAPAAVPPTPEPAATPAAIPAALSDADAISSAELAPPPPPAQPALSPEEIANEQRLYDEKMARFRSAKTMAENKQPIIPDAPYGGYDILDFVNDNVIKLPPKSERTTGEYDWAETLDLQPKYNRFLFSSRRGSNITAVAQRAFEENLIPDPTPDALMAAIESTARQRDDFQAEMDAQEERLKQMEAEIGAPLDSPGAGAWADSVIADSMETPFIGIDPRLMAAYTVKGAQLIREGVTTFARWSAEMVQRFGEKVRNYLQDVWMAARKTSEQGFAGTGFIPKANTSVFDVAAKPLRSRPANLSREDGTGAGNGWNAERQMSQNAVRALDLGKLMEPDFKIWLADEMGIPESAITKAVLSAANQNAQNLYREYHHVGKKADIMEFYDPREIALAPKFFLGAAKALKTKSHQQAARKAALKAWQTIREDLAASGQLGVWSFAETTTNKGGVLDQLDPQFKRRVENGELTVPQAIEEDRLLIIERGQSKSKHLIQQEAKTLSELEAKRDSGQGNERTLRQIEAAQDRQIKLQERIDSEIAEQLKNHPSNKMPAPVSRGRQVESNARFEGAAAPTRTEDVRLTDRATGATSDSPTSVSGEPQASTSGFKNLDTSGTTAGFLNTDILAEAADLIRQGFTNFAEWSRAMVTRFGQRIRDYLQDVWRLSEGGFVGTGDLTPSEWSAPRADPVLLTNAAEAERLISEGKAPGPTGNQGTMAGWKAEAAARMDEPGAGPALVSDLIAKGRAHTPVEYFMLEIYAGALDIQLDESSGVLADPLSTAEARSFATAQILAADIERDRVEIAARVSGSKLGAALGARRSAMAREEIPPLTKMVADLTLINDPTGQTPLAPEERRKVEKIHTDMVAAQSARDAQRETGTGGAEDTYKLELEKLLKEAREQLAAEKAQTERTRAALDEALKPRPEPGKLRKMSAGVGDRIKTAADAARARMAARGIRFSANPMFDLEVITDASIIMADYLRQGINGTIKMLEMFGDEIKPFLNQIRDKAEIYLEEEAKRKTPAGIKEKAAADIASGKGAPADLARQLALAHITDHLARQDKTMSAEKIADLVRADLEALQPGITTREARDLISGYGKSTKPAQEEAQRTLRDYKAQMRKLTQIEALRAGEPLKRTGPQRDEPTARQRELSKLLEELKRETGYQSRSREDELASIRDRIKRTLENQIEDLQRVLSGQARPTAPRERFIYDADLQALQTLRNNLQTLVEEMPAHKLATEQRRNNAAERAARASEAEWKRRAAAKEWSRPGRIQGPQTAEVTNAREAAQRARDDFNALKRAALPKADPEARQLAAFKRRLQRQIDNIEKRIKAGDFEAKKRTPRQIKHDEQSAALNLKLQERKREFIDLKIKQRMANMGLLGKSVEWFRTGIFTLRSIMAGGEFSAIGRQGILKALSHPIRFIGDLKAMTRAFQSKVGEQQMIDELWARPNAINGRYKVAGLALHNPDDYSELLAEGAARSALSDKIPWFSHTARAYTGLLNHMRADLFDMLVEKRSRKGQEDLSEATLRNLADFVNDSTGAGKLGFGKHVLRGTARDVASTLMFSPSFFMSRLRLLTGASLIGADKRTVAVIAPEYAKMAAGYLALFTLLNALRDAGEDELEKDIRSGAFLKMDFGKTSVDLMAGLSQMATFWARLISGQTKSRGEVVDIRGPNRPYNATDVPGVIWRFARSKESPQASVVFDWMTGEDSMGNPVDFSKPETWMKSAREMSTPMVLNSILDIRAAEPAPRAAALSAAAMIGIGTNVRNP